MISKVRSLTAYRLPFENPSLRYLRLTWQKVPTRKRLSCVVFCEKTKKVFVSSFSLTPKTNYTAPQKKRTKAYVSTNGCSVASFFPLWQPWAPQPSFVYHSNNGSSKTADGSVTSSTDDAVPTASAFAFRRGMMSFCTSFNKMLSKSSPPNLLSGCKGSTPKICWKCWASSRSSCDLSQSLKPCLPEPQQRQRWKKLQEHELEWHPLLLKDMQKFRAWLRSIWSLLQVWMAKDAMKLGKGSPHHKIRWFLMISPPLRTGSFQKSWSSSRSKSIWYDMESKFTTYSYNWGYSAANLSFVSWCSWKREDWKCQKAGALVGWTLFFPIKKLKPGETSGCFRKSTTISLQLLTLKRDPMVTLENQATKKPGTKCQWQLPKKKYDLYPYLPSITYNTARGP